MKKIIAKKPLAKKAVARKAVARKPVPAKIVATPKKTSWLGALVIANILGFIVVLIVNYLAVSIPLGGMTT